MRIFTATLQTETNTFSSLPTGWSGFEECVIERGSTGLTDAANSALMRLWGRWAAQDGHEVFHSVAAGAFPAGRTVRAVYEALRDEIVEDARRKGPFDVALLFLHGAMAAEGYDDCEGDLLQRLRPALGSGCVIGVEFDLHGHITEAMVEHSDVLIGFKEYPHIDAGRRAREVYDLCLAATAGNIRPVTAVHDCRMVNIFPTTSPPMAAFVAAMRAAEGRDGVLSVTLNHGFPWGDVAANGAKVIAIADGDMAKAEAVAKDFGERFWGIRDEVGSSGVSLDAALDAALAAPPGLAVIADGADNTGGGAPGDSTFMLRRVVERGLKDVAIGPFWDPMAVRICVDAGAGAALRLRIGGKTGAESGDPIDLDVVVRAVSEGLVQTGLGGPSPLGQAAWIECDGVHVVLCEKRAQGFSPDLFTGMGLPLDRMRIAVVKSMAHFRAGFAPIASAIFTTLGPGSLVIDYAAIPYQRRDLNYWPRVANPFAAESP